MLVGAQKDLLRTRVSGLPPPVESVSSSAVIRGSDVKLVPKSRRFTTESRSPCAIRVWISARRDTTQSSHRAARRSAGIAARDGGSVSGKRATSGLASSHVTGRTRGASAECADAPREFGSSNGYPANLTPVRHKRSGRTDVGRCRIIKRRGGRGPPFEYRSLSPIRTRTSGQLVSGGCRL